MNSKMFYQNKDLEYIKHKRSIKIFILILLSILFVSIITLFFIFSTYDTKNYFILAGTLTSLIFTFLIVLFIYQITDLNHIIRHFLSIEYQKEITVSALFIKIEDRPITIDHYIRAYPIEIKIDEDIKIVYLSVLYSFDFKENKKYKFILASEYIKGVKDEL